MKIYDPYTGSFVERDNRVMLDYGCKKCGGKVELGQLYCETCRSKIAIDRMLEMHLGKDFPKNDIPKDYISKIFNNSRFDEMLTTILNGLLYDLPTPKSIVICNEYTKDYHYFPDDRHISCTKYSFERHIERGTSSTPKTTIWLLDDNEFLSNAPDKVNAEYSLQDLVDIFKGLMVARYRMYYNYFIRHIKEDKLG